MTKERIEIIRQSLIPFVKKELLEINNDGLGKSDAKEFEKDLNEVLDLAIKALEQQSCDDCVSREQVLLQLTGVNLSDKTTEELIGLFGKRIQSLPPVTPTVSRDATNGDIITAIFPDIKIHEHEKTDICDAYIQIDISDFSIYVSKDWWDKPYKERR